MQLLYSHPLLYIALAVLLLAGCGKTRQDDAEYALARSEELLQLGEAALEGSPDFEAMLKNSTRPELQSQNDDYQKFLQAIGDYSKQYVLFENSQKMLDQGRFQELVDSLEKAERMGEDTLKLLEVRDLPQAMQALRSFCARRPYERSVDLEHALEYLKPYEPVLEESAVFRSFLEEQNARKTELQAQEKRQAVAALLERLDWAISTAERPDEIGRAVNELWRTDREMPFFRYLNAGSMKSTAALLDLLRTGNTAAVAEDELPAVELALALCADGLDEEQRKLAGNFLASFPQNVTLAGTAARAAFLKDIALYEKAIGMWFSRASEEQRMEKAPAFFAKYLELCGLRRDGGAGMGWHIPFAMAKLQKWILFE